MSKALQPSQRSAVAQTEWHDLEEQHFARRVAGAMEELARSRGINALVVVAPPRTLAELRDAFHTDVKAIILAEINKDLTNHPIGEIERLLTGGN